MVGTVPGKKRGSVVGRPPGAFGQANIYLPKPAVIREIILENPLVKTFVLEFEDELFGKEFQYLPGQFVMVSVPHCGEAPISFSSAPGSANTFALTVRKAGKLTEALDAMGQGDNIGIRGPYGRPFPMADIEGENIVFVAGGIGMAPLHSAILYCLANREKYGKISILYGSKTSDEICFKDEIERWRQDEQVECLLTVDEGDDSWNGKVGLVTTLLDQVAFDDSRDRALVCGPGIMIRFVIERLETLGFAPENLIITLERHMKCGVGLCGHCHFDEKLVCTDGPVFTRVELPRLGMI